MNKSGQLHYDAYRAAAHDPAQIAADMRGTGYAALYGSMRLATTDQQRWARDWDAARIYVLSREALEVVLEAGARLQPGQYPIPHPPALPMWIEFDSVSIQTNNVSWTGMLFTADEAGDVEVMIMGASMPLGFTYAPETLHWRAPLLQTAHLAPPGHRCEAVSCPLQIQRGTGRVVIATSDQDALLTDQGIACQCWGTIEQWTRMIAAFLAFLTAQGIEHEIVVLPVKPPPRHIRRDPKRVSAPSNPIRYQRISLAHPAPSVIRRYADGTADVEPAAASDAPLTRTIVRRPHPRLLIAGPGQRWKTTRIVFVAQSVPYERHVRNGVRFWVEE
ncbi:MAG: hypothetical protein KGH75_00630 [Rhodospirillales bacterium]|nr:hypothetical protein [Rhodospirillales bacterium]